MRRNAFTKLEEKKKKRIAASDGHKVGWLEVSLANLAEVCCEIQATSTKLSWNARRYGMALGDGRETKEQWLQLVEGRRNAHTVSGSTNLFWVKENLSLFNLVAQFLLDDWQWCLWLEIFLARLKITWHFGNKKLHDPLREIQSCD